MPPRRSAAAWRPTQRSVRQLSCCRVHCSFISVTRAPVNQIRYLRRPATQLIELVLPKQQVLRCKLAFSLPTDETFDVVSHRPSYVASVLGRSVLLPYIEQRG